MLRRNCSFRNHATFFWHGHLEYQNKKNWNISLRIFLIFLLNLQQKWDFRVSKHRKEPTKQFLWIRIWKSWRMLEICLLEGLEEHRNFSQISWNSVINWLILVQNLASERFLRRSKNRREDTKQFIGLLQRILQKMTKICCYETWKNTGRISVEHVGKSIIFWKSWA